MELVLDANVLFSALIKSGLTRELMLNDEIILYAPEFIIEEFLKHIDELVEKTKVEKDMLVEVVGEFLSAANVRFILLDDIKQLIPKAENISPDPDDVVYFALALRLNCGIWSNDKELKKQNRIQVYSTKDLADIF